MAIDPATLTTLGSASDWAWGKYGDQLLEKVGDLFADWAIQQDKNALGDLCKTSVFNFKRCQDTSQFTLSLSKGFRVTS